MSNAIAGPGVLLKSGDGATPTETFTTIAEVLQIRWSGLSTAVLDVTNQSSPNAVKEKLATILDAGQITFDCNLMPTNGTQNGSTGLIADWKNRVKRNYTLLFPDGLSTTWSFTAIVAKIPLDLPVEGVLKMVGVTLDITGLPTGM